MNKLRYELHQTHAYLVSPGTWSISELWVDRGTGESVVINRTEVIRGG